MPTNDREVFDKFTSDAETPAEIDFLTYAIFAFHKREWIQLFESQHNNQTPTQQEIENWIANITQRQYDDMREDAERFFDAASRIYLADEIEEQKSKAESILSEIKHYSSPWRHIGMALIFAIVAPIILGGVIYFLNVFDITLPIHFPVPRGSGQTRTA
jgi:hypothetical protein